jgi:hypothetical protein
LGDSGKNIPIFIQFQDPGSMPLFKNRPNPFSKKRILYNRRKRLQRIMVRLRNGFRFGFITGNLVEVDTRLLRMIGVWTRFQVEAATGKCMKLQPSEQVTYIISPNLDDPRVMEYQAVLHADIEPFETGSIWFGKDETLCFGKSYDPNQKGVTWSLCGTGNIKDCLLLYTECTGGGITIETFKKVI